MGKTTYKPNDPDLQNICKLIENASGRYSARDIFYDVVELMALTLAMTTDRRNDKSVHKAYQSLIEKHGEDKEDSTHYMGRIQYEIMNLFFKKREAKDIIDIFGPLHSAFNMGDSGLGQFFTPWHISVFMGKCILSKEDFAGDKFKTLSEPTCGAGGMILAAAQVVNEYRLDYREKLVAYGSDIDKLCCMMTYVQCSLYQIPAMIEHANALSMEPVGSRWFTPAFYQMGWPEKLGFNKASETEEEREEKAS